MPSDVRLQLSGVTKQFGPAVVLDHVDLQVRAGQVHGLIGQNGAGKSTLVKTLAGLYPDYSGLVTLDGRRAALGSPRQSRAEGIAVIHQEFSLVSEMTVAENLLLGQEPGRWRYSTRAVRSRAEALVEQVGIEIGEGVDATVGTLSPAIRQRIEIVKALADDVKVLILDEPTARLSEAERQSLFRVVRELADRGVGLLFISHFLEEVREVTDWLTVMRNGRAITSEPTKTLSVSQMGALMLGEKFKQTLDQEVAAHRADDEQPVVLEADGVSAGPRLNQVSISLRVGEIMGVAGLVGSGRTRLCRVLSGAERPTDGHLRLHGQKVAFANPRMAIARGVALIPEDRKHQGLSLSAPLTRNLSLMAMHERLGRWGVVPQRAVRRLGKRLVEDLEIHPGDIDAHAATLSGGNQQKVVLGKTFAAEPDVLIIDQPTAGVDIGTKAQIHRLLRERAAAGAAILVVSDDLEELYALGDRFHVLRQGRTIWQGTSADVTHEQLVHLVAAGSPQPPRPTATEDTTEPEDPAPDPGSSKSR
ncbi:sugar ABC transporter ATP-binding protein [Streptomyces herbicida]|uniref:sugar ABC transporter ATP-binding protein n=1 Tax=Streptomyces herbicida TaxID=3065675 RepID=UPI0029308996|nr:sugar ABC transporter ATP-binding protein [Streptomyces sp. NEAU-HV9]